MKEQDRIRRLLTPRIERDFWKKVHIPETPNLCWVWKGAKTSQGYGKMVSVKNVDGQRRELLAHRISFAIAGKICSDEQALCHRCDYPPCVNPEHLFPSTHSGNNWDMRAKGRHAKGTSYHRSNLTEKDVRDIREAAKNWDRGTMSRLCKKYGVKRTAIYFIVHRKTWKHVE